MDAGPILLTSAALDDDLVHCPLEARPTTLLLRHEPNGRSRLLIPPLRDREQTVRERMAASSALIERASAGVLRR